ncbi:hypothetical protein RND81_05G128900 [Saponaria officinalis]|uniref:Uncharacterized protein n=1 Tax=Saponaria officinalis TaxID=3572 RepID=A0AAW1KYK0_SAPOF
MATIFSKLWPSLWLCIIAIADFHRISHLQNNSGNVIFTL